MGGDAPILHTRVRHGRVVIARVGWRGVVAVIIFGLWGANVVGSTIPPTNIFSVEKGNTNKQHGSRFKPGGNERRKHGFQTSKSINGQQHQQSRPQQQQQQKVSANISSRRAISTSTTSTSTSTSSSSYAYNSACFSTTSGLVRGLGYIRQNKRAK